MRIAMVSEHASPLSVITGEDAGGQNVHVAELSMALADLGHDVVVYTRRTDREKPDTVSLGPGVRVEHVRAGPAEQISKDDLPRYMPEFAQRLRAAWRVDRPDVVHAHFWMSGLASLPIANELDLPLFQTFHALGVVKRRFQGSADTSPPERVETERTVARRCAMVIATSREERDELISWGVCAERVAVVPCGVDVGRFAPQGAVASRSAQPRLLSLGRLVERKGVDTVIRSMAHLPDVELVVAGGPRAHFLRTEPEAVRLLRIADQAGVADRVRFLGCVDRFDVPALLRSADVAVNVPWYEPFGISTVEAMACGVPVVASRVGGHVDTVVHGETGLLVPPRAPGRLGRAVRWLLSDRTARTDFAEAAAERARKCYSWAAVALRTEACFRHVAGGTRGLAPEPRPSQDEHVGTGTRGGEE